MSILIKGMAMPKNCWEDDCPCLNKEYGFCQADDDKGLVYSSKPDWCPLSDIPPHGRLVDADKAEIEGWTLQRYIYGPGSITVETGRSFSDLPTVIEAEEGE